MLLLKNLVLVLLAHNFVSCEQKVEDDRVSQNEMKITRMMEQMEKMWHEISKLNPNTVEQPAGNSLVAMNNTDELENRVLILELEMDTVQSEVINLFDDVAELQSQDSLTDLRLTTVEEDIEALTNVDAALEDRIASLEAAVAEPWTACESSPCDNAATCVDVNVDTFICLCRDGFFGPTCSNSYEEAGFFATLAAKTISPVPDPIVFNETRYNTGGHYDTTSGIFTVPLNGVYSVNINIRSQPDEDFGFFLVLDDHQIANSRNADAGGAGYMSTSMTIPLNLQAGQELWVAPFSLDAMYGADGDGTLYMWFAANLLVAY